MAGGRGESHSAPVVAWRGSAPVPPRRPAAPRPLPARLPEADCSRHRSRRAGRPSRAMSGLRAAAGGARSRLLAGDARPSRGTAPRGPGLWGGFPRGGPAAAWLPAPTPLRAPQGLHLVCSAQPRGGLSESRMGGGHRSKMVHYY